MPTTAGTHTGEGVLTVTHCIFSGLVACEAAPWFGDAASARKTNESPAAREPLDNISSHPRCGGMGWGGGVAQLRVEDRVWGLREPLGKLQRRGRFWGKNDRSKLVPEAERSGKGAVAGCDFEELRPKEEHSARGGNLLSLHYPSSEGSRKVAIATRCPFKHSS